jgi:hypothetical protein
MIKDREIWSFGGILRKSKRSQAVWCPLESFGFASWQAVWEENDLPKGFVSRTRLMDIYRHQDTQVLEF